MLVDANVLLYAVDRGSPHHLRSASWLSSALEGDHRVAIPWQTIGAFLRISTHPRVFQRALTGAEAWQAVEGWLESPVCWVPTAGAQTARILGDLVATHDVRGNLVTDAQLAALAIEHGLAVVSADSDFARFAAVRWINPLAS